MANFRVPVPTCLSFDHPGVDAGTLARNWSSLPGTIRKAVATVTVTTSAIRDSLERCAALLELMRRSALQAGEDAKDAAVWGWDALKLYKSLEQEGTLFILEAVPLMQSFDVVNTAAMFDWHVNKMGALHNEFSRKHQVGAMLPFNELAKWFAGTDFMKETLLKHYIEKQGAKYPLVLGEMRRMPTHLDFFETGAYSPAMKLFIDLAKNGRPVPVTTSVQGQNDALGNFRVDLKGELKPALGTPSGSLTSPYYAGKQASDPGVPLMFEGKMDWHDDWDFDSKVYDWVTGKEAGRSKGGHASVAAVSALVDGVPFPVDGETVPVVQYSGLFPVY